MQSSDGTQEDGQTITVDLKALQWLPDFKQVCRLKQSTTHCSWNRKKKNNQFLLENSMPMDVYKSWTDVLWSGFLNLCYKFKP